MKSLWHKKWNRSVQPRKQRKYLHNAPLHIKHNLVSVHLSKELRKKYGKRSIPVRKGDKVIVMRGQFKGHSGKVEKVSIKKTKLFVENVKVEKNDGTMAPYPISPSNIMITSLNLEDKKRSASLERNSEHNKKKEKKPEKPKTTEEKKKPVKEEKPKKKEKKEVEKK